MRQRLVIAEHAADRAVAPGGSVRKSLFQSGLAGPEEREFAATRDNRSNGGEQKIEALLMR